MGFRPNNREATLLAFAISYFVFFASARTVFARYYLPLFPILAVGGGGLAVTWWWWATRTRALAVAVVLVAVGYSVLLSAALTMHTSVQPQRALRAAMEQLVETEEGTRVPTVACPPEPFGDYTGLGFVLGGLRVKRDVLSLDRAWLRGQRHDFLIVPEVHEILVFRNEPTSEAAQTLRALAAGDLPYRLVKAVHTSFLHRDFYGWLDPYFRVAPERGEMGFRVYRLDVGSLDDGE
jgi:hypothetical protein